MLSSSLERALADPAASLATTLTSVTAGERELIDGPAIVIGVSSNVTLDLLAVFLRREALLCGRSATILPGSYDDPVGDLTRFTDAGVDHVVLAPFFDNFMPAFEARIASMDAEALEAKSMEWAGRLRLALEAGRGCGSIWLLRPHRFELTGAHADDAVAQTLAQYDATVVEFAGAYANVHLVDVGALIAELGHRASFDKRFYFQSKAPYSPALLSALARRISQLSRSFGTRFYKAIALDCDNTLWGGVVGEDLLSGIRLDPFDYPGNIFWRVQQSLASLEGDGLLLCLCTKNNPTDVAEVIADHPHMVLRDDMIAARRVNWQDKVTNLRELAEELNIGLESMIFLDDNPVEAEAVRAQLPTVTVFDVPPVLNQYPALAAQIGALYRGNGIAFESRSKTEQYRQRNAAAEVRSQFASHDDYLASLDLEADLRFDRREDAPRISELSQKSNQFNVLTQRWTVADVLAMMEDADTLVASIRVRNRFGDAGLTGIISLCFDDDTARVSNFLMSCRVLGQKIEFAIWQAIFARCRARGVHCLEATYAPTPKNAQVVDFFERLGLDLVSENGGSKHYRVQLDAVRSVSIPWIKVNVDE